MIPPRARPPDPDLTPGGSLAIPGLPRREPPPCRMATVQSGDLRQLARARQEVIPLPLEDGRVTFVPVPEEAR